MAMQASTTPHPGTSLLEVSEPPLLSVADLADGGAALRLDAAGAPVHPLAAVELDAVHDWHSPSVGEAATQASVAGCVLIGLAHRPPPAAARPLIEALTCTLSAPGAGGAVPHGCVEVAQPAATAEAMAVSVGAARFAALTLAGLLKITASSSVPDGLAAESLAYSMLLGGPEYLAWRTRTPRQPTTDTPVRVSRQGSSLRVVLDQPDRHNPFGRAVHDALIDVMAAAEHDRSVDAVELSGSGPSFCGGDDLDELGSIGNVAAAHLIRLRHSAGLAVHRIAGRVRAALHGACVGAGIEVPAFAGWVEAAADAYFQLPQLRMGLLPGAGGTVGITRRIGRWRTAYLALHGQAIDVDTALRWGLVDARA